MGFIRDFISIFCVVVGIYPTLLGIELAGEQFRVFQDLRGMFVGFGISAFGLLMIIFGFWLSTRRTKGERRRLAKYFDDLKF